MRLCKEGSRTEKSDTRQEEAAKEPCMYTMFSLKENEWQWQCSEWHAQQ